MLVALRAFLFLLILSLIGALIYYMFKYFFGPDAGTLKERAKKARADAEKRARRNKRKIWG